MKTKAIILIFTFLLFAAKVFGQCAFTTQPVASTQVCVGGSVDLTVVATGGETMNYQWFSNTSASNSGGILISTATSATYPVPTLTAGVYYFYCVATGTGATTCGPTPSIAATVTVNPLLPASVSITALPAGAICAGTSVTFTATPTNGGTTPTYKWYNGASEIGGETGSTYTSTTLANGNVITAQMTSSSEICTSGSPATSNGITMTVNPLLAASVSISALPAGAICAGTSVTFTATPTNGGTTPTYKWYNGASEIGGETGSTYTSTALANGNVITAQMTSSSEICTSGSPATSSGITMTINPTTIAGSVTGGTTICSGSTSGVLTLGVHTGSVERWEKSPDDATWTPISRTSDTYTSGSLTSSTYFRAVVKSGVCPEAFSASTLVTVDPVSNGGTVASAQTICNNTTPAPITVTDYVGTIVRWESSNASNFNTPVPIAVTTPTLTLGVHTADTWYRVVVKSGTCSEAISNEIKINVHTVLTSNITGGASPICYNTSPGGITASATGGNGIYTYAWKSTATGSTVLGTANIYTPGNLTATTGFYCDISSSCGPITTSTITITVRPQIILSGVSQNTQICSGSPAQIDLSGLLPSSSFTIGYSINGVDQTAVPGVTSDPGGLASFSTVSLLPVSNGKPIQIKTISTGTSPTCSANFTQSTLLIVNSATIPTLTGSLAPCINSTGNVYTTEAGMNSGTYVWTFSGGGTYTGGGVNDNTITVDWTTAATHTIGVNFTNANNCTAASPTVKNITVSALPTPTITGPASACINSSGNVYTTQTGKSGYDWEITGGTINSGGDGSNVAVVTWDNIGTQNITVNYANSSGCTAALPFSYSVAVNPLPVPAFLTAPSSVRVTSTGNVYTTESGMNNYIWTVSAGGSITAGGGSGNNSVTVTWNTVGPQSVSVKYTNSNNCTALAATTTSVTVNPLPSVSSVSITGTPAIGYTLNGNYTYTDGGSGSGINSTFRWLRNGTTIATTQNYVVQNVDKGFPITFEVKPVSTDGPLYPGTAVTSSPTIPVEDLSEIPVADQVCIEGVRVAGNILKGKYRYTHSKPEGISTYQWYSNGTKIPLATMKEYELKPSDVSNEVDITFEVTPVSSNVIPQTGLSATSNPLVKIPLTPLEYSVAVSSIPLTASPAGGIFSGPGVTNGIFSPGSVGIGGPYPIQYLLTIVNSATTCSQNVTKNVNVVANTTELSSFKPVYCQDEGPDDINVTGVPLGSISLGFYCTNPDAIVSATPWTVTINPAKLKQGSNIDYLFFRYMDISGYIYEISKSFVIDAVGTDIKIINLNPEYCADAPKANLTVTGATPKGGTGVWTGTIISDMAAISASVNVALGTPGTTYPITYQYTTPLGCKSAIIPGSVKINPLPNPSFLLNPFYNYDGVDVPLVPVQSSGTFTGDGVLGDRLFPDRAGLGEHTINYYIKDANGCDDAKDLKTTIKKAQGTFNDIPAIICYRDTTFNVYVTGLPTGYTVESFINTKNSIIHTAGSTSAEYSVAAAGAGIDTLTLFYKLDGVDYWISKTVNIDSLGIVVIQNLFAGDKICDNRSPFELFPSLNGGVFSGPVAGNYLDPTKTTGPTSVSYKYTNQKTGCFITTTVPFSIIPAPQVSFIPKDVCIETSKDSTFFLNTTISSDPVYAWTWTFAEIGAALDFRKEPGFLYKTGGIHSVSLNARTESGCTVTTTMNIDIGVRPIADFTWENDCFAPGAIIKLFDATITNFPVVSRTWNFNDGALISSALNPEYSMQDTGFLKVKYVVRTSYTNCADTIVRQIYVRPTVSITQDGFYNESFETGKNGWGKDDADILSSWQFGTPDRRVINNAASGKYAWFTRYDTIKQEIESSAVISPCFDFTDIQRPMISLKTFTRFNRNRNGAALQYKTDENTSTWQYVGTQDDGINWYNSTLINGRPGGEKIGWTTSDEGNTDWIESRHVLDELQGKKNVKFRIAYGTDGTSTNNEGIAFDDIWIGERSRKVLLEHFTNTFSRKGSEATALLNNIIAGREKDVINIQYHTNFPDDDPFYLLNPGDASARIFSYGLSRVPYSLIDGGFSKDQYASLADYKTLTTSLDGNDLARRSLLDAHFEVSVSADVTGEVLTVNSAVTSVNELTEDNLVLYLVVTEKKNSEQTGALGEKEFKNVFRKLIPDAGGIDLRRNWATGETYSIPEQTWVIENMNKSSDIEIIAFIQNSQTKQVYQANSVIETYTKGTADISKQQKNAIGADDEIPATAISFGLYPNPTENKLRIEFSDPLNSDADVRVYDLQGAVKKTFRVAMGESDLFIEDIGLKAGIYMVRISAGGADLGFTKLIITGQ